MAKVIGDISVSLDGFVTGPDPDPEHGLGQGGEGLHRWALDGGMVDKQVLDAMVDRTGAVLMGRHTFDVVDGPHGWADDMGYGAERDQSAAPPVLVVTRRPPETVRLADRFTFVVDGIRSAVDKARSVADDRDVVVMGGGELIRGCLDAGLLDELQLHLSPVLLGGGTPLFAAAGPPTRKLEQFHVRVSAIATHLSYRVVG
jgi:dihydrofolate reductase